MLKKRYSTVKKLEYDTFLKDWMKKKSISIAFLVVVKKEIWNIVMND